MTTADEMRAQAQALLDKAAELDTQLSGADVRRLWAEGRHHDIVQAKQDGRLRDYLTSTTDDDTTTEGA